MSGLSYVEMEGYNFYSTFILSRRAKNGSQNESKAARLDFLYRLSAIWVVIVRSILPVLNRIRPFRVGKIDRGDIPRDLHHVGTLFIDVRHYDDRELIVQIA